MRYNILIVKPEGYPHSGTFFEVAEWLRSALRMLNQEADIGSQPVSDARNVIFGSHLLPWDTVLPHDSIIYNLEQIYARSPWLTVWVLALLRSFEVWDYSPINAAAYAQFGLPPPKVVAIGFAPELERICPRLEDIDVLFYGAWNERRDRIVLALKAAGLNVVHLWGVYGSQRDEMIARSKIVLNMHYYEAQVFEIVRVSYLLNNRRCVVSENGPDEAAQREFEGGVAFAPYEQLVETCVRLCADLEERERIRNKGYEILRRRNSMGLVRALGEGVVADLLAKTMRERALRVAHARPWPLPSTSAPKP